MQGKPPQCMSTNIDTVIFDLGGVLIDWNPRYLYRKIFKSEDEIEWFLKSVCTSEWNDALDAGRPFADGIKELTQRHPEYTAPIRAWLDRWPEMISGPVSGTVDILREIKTSRRFRLYALTNWSHETFPWALKQFDFLSWFEGVVASGIERMRKPHPEFFQVLFDRYSIDPARAVFIDDNIANIEAAKKLNLNTIAFQSPDQLRTSLKTWGI